MQSKPGITLVIPTYSNIEGFLKLVHKLKSGHFPIVIIDNLPSEEKRVLAQTSNSKHQASITYLPQAKNIGFAKAVNLGINIAQTDWVAILNDDIMLDTNNIFQRLLEFANKNGYSAVSPVLKDLNGNLENLGYRVLPFGKVELNFNKPEIIDQRSIDGLTAACLLIKKADFERVGGFDERFFA